MDNSNQDNRSSSFGEAEEDAGMFPSWRMIISLYSIGAVVALVFAFNPSLDSLQTTNCLLISWMLALGALAMSILCEPEPIEEVE